MKIGKTYLLVLICSSLIGACNQSLSAEPPSSSHAALPDKSLTRTTKAEAGENDAGLLRPSFSKCVDKSEGNTSEMQACMEAEYRFHDGRVHAAYTALIASQDVSGRKLVAQSQQDWLSKTEEDCAWDARHEGQAQQLEAEYCNMRNTAKRADELEGRIAAVK